MDKFETFQKMVDESKNIVFFGGAGVSTASGIPDFRSSSGIYNNGLYTAVDGNEYAPEEMLHINFYINHTIEFYDFYRKVMCATGYEPNVTHYKLAELEKAGKLRCVITQNIDGLHQKAGSKAVYELHGSIYRNKCTRCGKEFPVEYVQNAVGVPYCDKCNNNRAMVKPMVTLYGEQLPNGVFDKATMEIAEADMLIIAGTSLNVMPAATLVSYYAGDRLVIINKDTTDKDKYADLVINDDMTKIFEKLVIR